MVRAEPSGGNGVHLRELALSSLASRRPDERGGGGRGGQRPGARVSGGPGRKAKTPWGIQDLISGGSRILIRGGGPPKKNVGLATLGMIVTTLYLHTHKHISGE